MIVNECGNVPLTFDDIQVALAFLRTLAHQFTPDQFLDFLHAYVASPDAAEKGKDLLTACHLWGA